MNAVNDFILFVACIRLMTAGGFFTPTPTPPPPQPKVDGGPLYIHGKTATTTIDGVDYEYVASKEREQQIIEGFKKLRLGQNREQVRKAMGPPDRAEAMYGKERIDGPFHGWGYEYRIRIQAGGPYENDARIHVFFDANDRLNWAVPVEIEGLLEIGSAETKSP